MGAVVDDTSGAEQFAKDFGDSVVPDAPTSQGLLGGSSTGGDTFGGGGGY